MVMKRVVASVELCLGIQAQSMIRNGTDTTDHDHDATGARNCPTALAYRLSSIRHVARLMD